MSEQEFKEICIRSPYSFLLGGAMNVRDDEILKAFKELVSNLSAEELEEEYRRAVYESRDSYILDDPDDQ